MLRHHRKQNLLSLSITILYHIMLTDFLESAPLDKFNLQIPCTEYETDIINITDLLNVKPPDNLDKCLWLSCKKGYIKVNFERDPIEPECSIYKPAKHFLYRARAHFKLLGPFPSTPRPETPSTMEPDEILPEDYHPSCPFGVVASKTTTQAPTTATYETSTPPRQIYRFTEITLPPYDPPEDKDDDVYSSAVASQLKHSTTTRLPSTSHPSFGGGRKRKSKPEKLNSVTGTNASNRNLAVKHHTSSLVNVDHSSSTPIPETVYSSIAEVIEKAAHDLPTNYVSQDISREPRVAASASESQYLRSEFEQFINVTLLRIGAATVVIFGIILLLLAFYGFYKIMCCCLASSKPQPKKTPKKQIRHRERDTLGYDFSM